MRQIKEENAKFLTWKKEKKREVKQLKEKVCCQNVWYVCPNVVSQKLFYICLLFYI